MGHDSGKKSTDAEELRPDRTDEAQRGETQRADPGGALSPIPELVRRAVATGLSGFFFTEEAIRRAVGETLPKDWSDFAAEQSEQLLNELLDRLTTELGRTFANVDAADVLSKLVAGKTIEIKAEIRLKPDDAERVRTPKSGPSRD